MVEFLILVLIIFSSVCLWLLIEGRKKPIFLVWFIPVFLLLITSIYFTYTSLLGLPKNTIPEKGLYLKHYVDEPKWIYLWILGKDNIPISYQIIYTREAHKTLIDVRGKTAEGRFMVLDKVTDTEGVGEKNTEEDNNKQGYTIGGDISFYEWDYESDLPPKTQ